MATTTASNGTAVNPEINSGSGSGTGTGTGSGENRRSVIKRRAPSNVTPIACNNCQRAKAKCDGKKPVCQRCIGRGHSLSCKYEMHIKTAKQEMVREIQDLQDRNSSIERIMHALRSGAGSPEIIDRLHKGESYKSIAESLGTMHFSELSPERQQELSKTFRDYDTDSSIERTSDPGVASGDSWTTVTSDTALTDHLLTLYFTWVHPVHMIFSRTHFMASYRNHSNLYCTSALVNAICAMGCHLYDAPNDIHFPTQSNPHLLRVKFMEEARSLVREGPDHKLANIQTFAVMFLVSLSAGKGSKFFPYIRLAADALNHRLESHYATQAAEITRWGIYALSVDWGQFTYQVPALFHPPPALDYEFDHDYTSWQYYRYKGDESRREELPSLMMQTAPEHTKLLHIIHDTISAFYHDHRRETTARKTTARDLLQHYRRYLDWEKNLPKEISMADNNALALPHVMAIHVQYYTALVQLFRPLLGIQDMPPDVHEHIRLLVIKYALQGIAILRTYRNVYTCRYEQPMQGYCLVHLCDAALRFHRSGYPEPQEVVRFGLTFLKEAGVGRDGYSVCQPLQEAFRRTAVECQIPMPDDIENLMGDYPDQIGIDDIIDACTRMSYTQPTDQVLWSMDHALGQEFAVEWQRFIAGDDHLVAEPSRGSEYMNISSILNV